MIEIDEGHFGYWPNEQHTWLFQLDEPFEVMGPILEQLYSQMVGWA